ncbi:MAG: Asp-tRNA(Asn)/Glu-tRNA(Gln) amidotransferase subunit GatA [Vallitaleaceae bacterium]|jgi:aspartyl-tRNA(Asn)/glutamyl-tRNA(Gln) amidotransferase subunit A|nr:Asp-tRNA(Asn)/Glu-tRNA(Gln) amidotransferase subunit GatA [Vallitaleaceae bacterium]
MALYQLKAHVISALIQNKEMTSEEITKAFLDRIEAVEPKIDAFITISSEEALKQARAVDVKIARGEKLSSLAGVPIAIKDNMCTKGILTTCGSKILNNFIPPYNATVVNKIHAADMVILGKLNMDEFAMGSSTENSYYKVTKNPWNLKRVPGGSSGGSAAAVAADMAAFTLGSDTGGSIRQPAHYCGVVGMKPTYGTVSRYGLVAFASSLDQIGPLTKDVKDMALAMNLIMGHDPMDSSSAPIDYPDFSKSIGEDVRGMRVALPKEFLGEGIQKEVKESVLSAVRVLEGLGMVVEEVSMALTDIALPAYYLISSAEASSNLARFDGVKYGYRAKEYDDLIDLYQQTRDEGFGDEVKRRIMLGTYALSSGYYDAYYKKAQRVRTLLKQEFSKLFESYDLVLTPTGPTTAFEIGAKVDNPIEMYLNDIITVPVNIAGLPALSINSGFDQNKMPIGIQLIGDTLKEHTILKAAYAYEQARELPGGVLVEL